MDDYVKNLLKNWNLEDLILVLLKKKINNLFVLIFIVEKIDQFVFENISLDIMEKVIPQEGLKFKFLLNYKLFFKKNIPKTIDENLDPNIKLTF